LRILTLDGGGMRGLFEARVLQDLERRLGRPLAEAFDLVSGTSTGGIVALGLTVAGRPAAEIAELYEEHGPKIFRTVPVVTRVRQFFVSKYDRGPLDETLRDELGDRRLSEATTRVLVPAFSLAQRDIVWFDSAGAVPGVRVRVAPGNPLARDVAAATSAAPTIFDPARVGGLEGEWLDGGVGADDPTPLALAIGLHDHRDEDVTVLSIGTGGFFPDYPKRLRGVIRVGLTMPDLVLYPTGLVAHDTADALGEAIGRVQLFRVAPSPANMPATEDASPEAIRRQNEEAARVVAAPATQAAFAAIAG
jgi:patatin-like phospholipase/acyl hydrolase